MYLRILYLRAMESGFLTLAYNSTDYFPAFGGSNLITSECIRECHETNGYHLYPGVPPIATCLSSRCLWLEARSANSFWLEG